MTKNNTLKPEYFFRASVFWIFSTLDLRLLVEDLGSKEIIYRSRVLFYITTCHMSVADFNHCELFIQFSTNLIR